VDTDNNERNGFVPLAVCLTVPGCLMRLSEKSGTFSYQSLQRRASRMVRKLNLLEFLPIRERMPEGSR
jgi:hypothetical protein